MFCQYAEDWVDRSLDTGPFVLVHGDLEIFNLLLGDDMSIVSVLDWEWSRVVPRQFFEPPL
jgi:aminoglycoside phosphotransferase (APT) family kinase protein